MIRERNAIAKQILQIDESQNKPKLEIQRQTLPIGTIATPTKLPINHLTSNTK